MARKCKQIQDELLFFLDRTKRETDRDVEAHLKDCEDCSARLQSILITKKLLSDLPRRSLSEESLSTPERTLDERPLTPHLLKLPVLPLPEGFEQQVLEEIHGEKARQPTQWFSRTMRFIQPLAAAAVIISASLLSFSTLKSLPEGSRTINFDFSFNKSLYFHTLGSSTHSKDSINGKIRSSIVYNRHDKLMSEGKENVKGTSDGSPGKGKAQ